jgi:serine/threonine protein kinase
MFNPNFSKLFFDFIPTITYFILFARNLLGFFCPEMITQGSYYGDKSDVWSIGGIMLELILGNERFTECWMGAYEYEILQNRERFSREIDQTVKKLPSKLPDEFSKDLKDFIMQFVKMKSTERPTVETMCQHPWVASAVTKMRAQQAKN